MNKTERKAIIDRLGYMEMIKLLKEFAGQGVVAETYEEWKKDTPRSKRSYIEKFKSLTDEELMALFLSTND